MSFKRKFITVKLALIMTILSLFGLVAQALTQEELEDEVVQEMQNEREAEELEENESNAPKAEPYSEHGYSPSVNPNTYNPFDASQEQLTEKHTQVSMLVVEIRSLSDEVNKLSQDPILKTYNEYMEASVRAPKADIEKKKQAYESALRDKLRENKVTFQGRHIGDLKPGKDRRLAYEKLKKDIHTKTKELETVTLRINSLKVELEAKNKQGYLFEAVF